MSSQSCNYVSNNKYSKSPPRMDDARHFTDYRPNCHVNNLVASNNGILNSFEYRMFLTHNANNLMELNRSYAVQKNGNGECKQPYHQGTMMPEQQVQVCNGKSCNTDFVNQNGLGVGRNYNYNAGQCSEWPTEGPNSKNSNACADSNSLFSYYGHMDTKAQGAFLPRVTMPSGGDAMKGGEPQPYNL